MRAVIFLGPSLAIDEAKRVLPDAIYLPPARQSDLLSAVVNLEPNVVGLIDGVFLHTPSVWHKEILFALDRGVHVYGASSIGALRAAETAHFGMVGIGEIYRQYASGDLTDDDEVALAHGPAEYGYRKISEPMVNIRATLTAARDAGVLDQTTAARIVEAGKSLHFSQRFFPDTLAIAGQYGVPPEDLTRLTTFIETSYVDLKARDATLLLETIRALPEDLEPFRSKHSVAANAGLETMYNRDRQVLVRDVLVPLADIAEYTALHDENFDLLNFNALNRAAAVALARLLRIEVSPEAIEAEGQRFRRSHGLEEDAAFADWLTRNNEPLTDFKLLMKEAALCRTLHRWLIYARFTERTTRLILDQLRWENRYAEWADRAARQQQLIENTGLASRLGSMTGPLADLLEAHQEWTGVHLNIDPEQWAEEAGFNSRNDFKLALVKAALARQAVLDLFVEALPPEQPADAGDLDGQELPSPPI